MSIIKKKKKHDKIVLLEKDKVNVIEVIIYSTFINSYITHDKFVSINNVLREYYEMKKEIKNSKNSMEYMTQKQWKPILSVLKKYI